MLTGPDPDLPPISAEGDGNCVSVLLATRAGRDNAFIQLYSISNRIGAIARPLSCPSNFGSSLLRPKIFASCLNFVGKAYNLAGIDKLFPSLLHAGKVVSPFFATSVASRLKMRRLLLSIAAFEGGTYREEVPRSPVKAES